MHLPALNLINSALYKDIKKVFIIMLVISVDKILMTNDTNRPTIAFKTCCILPFNALNGPTSPAHL